MKVGRVLLFVVLAAAVVLAWLVRERSAESGESYAEALRSVLKLLRDACGEMGSQAHRAVQNGKLAAQEREEAFDRDLAFAGRTS